MKLISDKISYKEGPGMIQFVILGKIERWKESPLTAWLLAWIFVGGVVFNEYYHATEREMRMGLIIFLIFWAYYFWQAGRTWLYRRGGNELIRLEGDTLLLKRSFFTYGKSRVFYLDIIKDFKPVQLSKTSFAYANENGWWILGGEKLGFHYQGKFVKFAMQISEQEAQQIHRLLSQRMKRVKKSQP